MVTEQDEMVAVIDQRGEEVTHNVDKAQEELGGAVVKARSARRKKWWCLLIVREYSLIILCSLYSPFDTVPKKPLPSPPSSRPNAMRINA